MRGRTAVIRVYCKLELDRTDLEEVICECGNQIWVEIDSDFKSCVFGDAQVSPVESRELVAHPCSIVTIHDVDRITKHRNTVGSWRAAPNRTVHRSDAIRQSRPLSLRLHAPFFQLALGQTNAT
jgi:hypothetical protein